MTRLLIPLLPQASARQDFAAALSEVPTDRAASNGHAGAPDPDLAVTGPSLQHWSKAVTAGADATLLLDPEGSVVAASVAAARLLRKPLPELLGRPLLKAAAFVDFHAAPRSIGSDGAALVPLQALRTNRPARGLLRLRHEDSQLTTCDVLAAPLHDAQGRLVGALVLLDNVEH